MSRKHGSVDACKTASIHQPQTPHRGRRPRRLRIASALITGSLITGCLLLSSGCTSIEMPSAAGVDLMNPSASLLFPGQRKKSAPYAMNDGTVPGMELSPNGALTEEAYLKIREAKAQNAIVLQVAGDPEPVRVLPLPDAGQSVFVSELLTQTGVMSRFGAIDATLYRAAPNSIAGIKMQIEISNGRIDPASDYSLRPGDRIQVTRRRTSLSQSVVNLALRR